jgi:hypothetical protein
MSANIVLAVSSNCSLDIPCTPRQCFMSAPFLEAE